MKDRISVNEIANYFQDISVESSKKFYDSGLKKHTEGILNYFKLLDLSQDTILEIGCGMGGLLIEFLKLNSKFVIGFDLSKNMIQNAIELSKNLKFESKSLFLTEDFNKFDFSKNEIFLHHKPQIIIADRVFCCSPVSMQILEKILSFDPTFIVLVLPRKNPIYRNAWRTKLKIKDFKLWIKSTIPTYFYLEAEITNKCKQRGYVRDFQTHRYVWETLIYKRIVK